MVDSDEEIRFLFAGCQPKNGQILVSTPYEEGVVFPLNKRHTLCMFLGCIMLYPGVLNKLFRRQGEGLFLAALFVEFFSWSCKTLTQ